MRPQYKRIIPTNISLLRVLSKVTIGVLFATLPKHAYGFELNWQEVDWDSSDDPIQEQFIENVDESQIDISISLSISGVDSFGSDTVISDGNLLLGANYNDRSRVFNHIDVNIRFSSAVSNVFFSLEDVDKGGSGTNAYWEDIIENAEASMDQTPVASTNVDIGSTIITDTATDPGDILYRGSQSDSFSERSRLIFLWEAPVDQLSFRYSGGENTRSNPSFQVIGLSGISFHEYNAVPEPGTVVTATMIALLLGFITWKKRTKERAG